jgi:hypothetical protein
MHIFIALWTFFVVSLCVLALPRTDLEVLDRLLQIPSGWKQVSRWFEVEQIETD